MPAPQVQGRLGRPRLASVKGNNILDGERPRRRKCRKADVPVSSLGVQPPVFQQLLLCEPHTSRLRPQATACLPVLLQVLKPPVLTVLPTVLHQGSQLDVTTVSVC